MESDERPTKMRKTEHAGEEEVAPEAEITPTNSTNDAHAPVIAENNEAANETGEPPNDEAAAPKISKNQLKKLRRQERWEAGRDERKQKRKEKVKEKKERRREAWTQEQENEDGSEPKPPVMKPPRHSAGSGTQVPITVIFDCDFEDLMFDKELKSLGLQITRCYSDNRNAKFRTHLAVSSFGGKLKERFDTVLAQQYVGWKGFQFFEEDFVAVAEKAKEWMSGPKGGEVAGALKQDEKEQASEGTTENTEEGEIVYLSSESENVLTHLKPNSTYIIGGLVDKNRYKGVCHKRAVNRGIKTAKLPIGEYLQMNSRQVLVTNHVLEIMLKWMDCGDWGKAFMEVIPKRKGGKLREGGEEDDDADAEEAEVKEQEDQEMVDAAKEAEVSSGEPAIETTQA
ncbi:hypothetical protein P153DRAFT_315717, partial [Dothidotthia symphoricarpi CBS 119687]